MVMLFMCDRLVFFGMVMLPHIMRIILHVGCDINKNVGLLALYVGLGRMYVRLVVIE